MALKMVARHHWRKAYKRWEIKAIAKMLLNPPVNPQFYEWSYQDGIAPNYFEASANSNFHNSLDITETVWERLKIADIPPTYNVITPWSMIKNEPI